MDARDGFNLVPEKDGSVLVVRCYNDLDGPMGEGIQGHLKMGKDGKYHFDGRDPDVIRALKSFYEK